MILIEYDRLLQKLGETGTAIYYMVDSYPKEKQRSATSKTCF